MEERVVSAALAGLLHDIGKFSQRAGVGKTEAWDRDAQAAMRYEHALASYGFVQQFVPAAWRSSLSAVAYHHQPQTTADRWVQLADWMSSSEREQDEDTKAPYLQTVFSRVDRYPTPSYWPLTPLKYTDPEAIFPARRDVPEWNESYQQAYAGLWDAFADTCKARGLVPETRLSPPAYLENLLTVLQEYTWSIPSAYWKSVPDVSLFDHLRTTAALAACLAGDNRPDEWCGAVWGDLKAGRPSQPAALLVGGDFTGIQDFIYTLSSSGAAKSLRARSFYLQLLGEVIALGVLDDLGLPSTNLLYVGGGGFQLLAPTGAEGRLPDIERALTDRLLTAHQGALGLTLAWESVRAHEFANFADVYTRLGQALGLKKRQPFGRASTAMLARQLGVPLSLGGDPLRFCRVTGDDWDVQERNGEFKSGFVLSLEELGRRLPHATHLVLSPVSRPNSGRPRTWAEGLRQFGFDAALVTEQGGAPDLPTEGLVRVWRLDPGHVADDTRWLKVGSDRAQIVVVDRPMAKLVPLGEDGEVSTFDELAREKAHGIKRWGVLRMDVDNLGMIFHEGLGSSATLSRIASLSFGVRLFFEGLLPALAAEDEGERLYIQYAGGDDVFVVGAWDALPPYALRIREQFRRYAGGNPAFTLSAGIAVVDANFPLYQAARMAQEAEEAAKDFQHADNHRKDAVNFLGRAGSWEQSGQMAADAQLLAGWARSRLIPASLLQNFQALAQQIEQAEAAARRTRTVKPRYGRWTWMAAYQITRVLERLRRRDAEAEQARQKITEMQAAFLAPGAEGKRVGLTARWAQFLARGEK